MAIAVIVPFSMPPNGSGVCDFREEFQFVGVLKFKKSISGYYLGAFILNGVSLCWVIFQSSTGTSPISPCLLTGFISPRRS
jgi:hypothetical protein